MIEEMMLQKMSGEAESLRRDTNSRWISAGSARDRVEQLVRRSL
jgi:hypothetical protein